MINYEPVWRSVMLWYVLNDSPGDIRFFSKMSCSPVLLVMTLKSLPPLCRSWMGFSRFSISKHFGHRSYKIAPWSNMMGDMPWTGPVNQEQQFIWRASTSAFAHNSRFPLIPMGQINHQEDLMDSFKLGLRAVALFLHFCESGLVEILFVEVYRRL